MIYRIYKIVFWFFLAQSALILVGINLDLVTYGIEVQTPLMAIAIVLGLVVGIVLRLLLKKIKFPIKERLALVFSLMMVSLCFYYVLEDKFELTF